MKRGLIIGVIIAIVIIAILLFYFIASPENKESTYAPSAENIENITPPEIQESPNESKTYNIELEGYAFNPPIINIKAGDTIIWTNKDSVKHTVTSDSGNELSSPLFGLAETYSHTFEIVGTYEYHCTPHPSMKAKVIVN